MPQDSCHQHKNVGQITVIKHEPRISQPSKMFRVIRISALNGIGETDGPDILNAFRLLQTTFSYQPDELNAFLGIYFLQEKDLHKHHKRTNKKKNCIDSIRNKRNLQRKC